jgi:V8-like Glu-specific endopeptidase
MKNPIHLGHDLYEFRGYPVCIKRTKYNENIVNIIFHSDTQKKYEKAEDLLCTSFFINEDSSRVSLGEIALQCENKFLVVTCKKKTFINKRGEEQVSYDGVNITIIPQTVYTNEYTKSRNIENELGLTDEELNDIQNEYF